MMREVVSKVLFGVDDSQARIKIARRNMNNLSYTDDTTLKAQIEEELKGFLLKVKEESEELEPLDGSERAVKKLARSATFESLRSQHPVPSLHGKQIGKKWKQ